jgi:serine/threonine protein kinase
MTLHCLETHYKGLHVQRNLHESDIINIRNVIEKTHCKTLIVTKRIGTPSERATVWEAILPVHRGHYVLAVKIPHVYNEKEYEIAKLLSNKPQHFLAMFAKIECDVNIYNKTFPRQLLFIELAIGDLRQILDDTVTPSQLNDYIIDVFDAVSALADLGIKHNDLHLGNVFIVGDGREYTKAVLGDFGESVPAKFVESNCNDLMRFFTDLKANIPSYLTTIFSDRIDRYVVNIRPLFAKLEETNTFNQTERNKLAKESIQEAKRIWNNS